MKNTITIDAKNSCACDLVSVVDDGTNSLFLEIHADVTTNPVLEISAVSVDITKDVFIYEVPFSYWRGTGTLQFRIVDDSHAGDYFNITKIGSLSGNITLTQVDNFNYALCVQQTEADRIWSMIRDRLYPVGSIYCSVSSDNPSTIYGGTWVQIKGRFLFGVGANDANSNTSWGSLSASAYNVGSPDVKGGRYAHNHSQASTTGSHTLTISEIPSHNHTQRFEVNGYSGWTYTNQYYAFSGYVNPKSNPHSALVDVVGTKNSGGGGSHNHSLGSVDSTNVLPPFYSVYMWKRTA